MRTIVRIEADSETGLVTLQASGDAEPVAVANVLLQAIFELVGAVDAGEEFEAPKVDKEEFKDMLKGIGGYHGDGVDWRPA